MEIIQTAWDTVVRFFDGFTTGNTPISVSQLTDKPADFRWILTMCAVLGAYLLLFVLLPLFQWGRYLRGKPVLFRFWFAFLTQTFFVVNAVFLLSLCHICNSVTLIFVILLYAVLVRCHGRWRILKTRFFACLDGGRRMLGGRYGMRLFRRKCRRKLRAWTKRVWKAFFRHVGAHAVEYLLLSAILLANLWFYSYGAMHWNSYGFGDEYTHSQWVYQITQGNVFCNGIYPFAMHCKIFALNRLFFTSIHDTVLYFGLCETMMMLLGVYTFLRTVSRRRTVALVGLILSSFAPYVPILVIRRFQWSLPEECAIYLIFPTAFFLIRWLRDDILPMPARHTGPIRFVRSFLNRNVFTDNLILFAISASLVTATHFYTAIIAILACVALCIVYLAKILEENRVFPLMLATVGAVVATVLPYAISLMQGNYFEPSIEWALNVAGSSAKDKQSLTATMLMLAAAALAAVVAVSLVCWGFAQIRNQQKKKPAADMIFCFIDGSLLTAGVYCLWRYSRQLGLTRFYAILRGNIVSKGLFGTQWGEYIIDIALLLLALSLLALLFGCGERARISLSVLLVYIGILTLYCLPQLGFPQLMDQVRVSIFASVMTPILIALVFDYLFDFPVPAILTAFFAAMREKRARRLENAELPAAVRRRAKTRKRVLHLIKSGVGTICMTAVSVGLSTILVCAGQLHPLTEMEFTQYNAAVQCVRSIIRDYDNHTWTLVSPTDELFQTVEYGFHEETVQMISDIDRKTYYTLPSEYLFFFVEKNVLHYAQTLEYRKGEIVSDPVSREEAMKPFVLSSSFASNYNKNRLVVMSKMNQWAKAFKERYPNELKVYYEDDDFVCYLLRQNTYSLYNLDVDYGYRPPVNKDE